MTVRTLTAREALDGIYLALEAVNAHTINAAIHHYRLGIESGEIQPDYQDRDDMLGRLAEQAAEAAEQFVDTSDEPWRCWTRP